jgi:tryptophan synthase alpha chain
MADPASPRAQLAARLAEASRGGPPLLLPYLTAGLPDPAHSVELFVAMADAGADGFEVGLPYSDPLMDGPVVHAAGLAALERGATMDVSLAIAADVRAETGKPVLVMTYVNPVLRMGPAAFARRVAAAGVAGVIIADLPAEEAPPFRDAFGSEGVGLVLFVAPTTRDDRLAAVAAGDPLFLYGVAELGVTGERDDAGHRARDLATRVHALTDVPLVLGVGISTPTQAAVAAGLAEGVIVGSALVRRVLQAATGGEAAEALAAAVAELADAVHGVPVAPEPRRRAVAG